MVQRTVVVGVRDDGSRATVVFRHADDEDLRAQWGPLRSVAPADVVWFMAAVPEDVSDTTAMRVVFNQQTEEA